MAGRGAGQKDGRLARSRLRIVAHFSNLVLISAFFGLGPGVLLRRLRTPL
jgi:hypothetical protein